MAETGMQRSFRLGVAVHVVLVYTLSVNTDVTVQYVLFRADIRHSVSPLTLLVLVGWVTDIRKG